MGFAVTAVYLLISNGFHWRAAVAGSVAGVAAGVSRYLYAGQPDPRLEAGQDIENSTGLKRAGKHVDA